MTPKERPFVVRVAMTVLTAGAMMFVPVKGPQAVLVLPQAVEDVLVNNPLDGVGGQETQRNSDHDVDL